jgi:hypothetical protein
MSPVRILSTDDLLPPDTPGLPDEIAEANRAAFDADQRRRANALELRKAREELKAAPSHDRNLRTEAMAAGEPPPAKPTEPRKRAKVDELERNVRSLEQLATQRREQLDAAVERNVEAYLTSRREAAESLRQELDKVVPAFVDLLPRYLEALSLLESAKEWRPGRPLGKGIRLDRRGQLAEKFAAALKSKRFLWRQRPALAKEAQLLELLAALQLRLELAREQKKRRVGSWR